MKTLIAKMTSALSGAVAIVAGLTLAGLGFAVVATLATFALAAMGVAMLAAPFLIDRSEAAQDETQADHVAQEDTNGQAVAA